MLRRSSYLVPLLAAACAIYVFTLVQPGVFAESVALEKKWLGGAVVHVITADLGDPRIRIDIGLSEKGLYHSEPFARMVKRRAPIAAVTGTYFDTRSLLPVGTIVIDGRKVHASAIGNTVCFLGSNQVRFVDTAKGEACDMAGAACGLRTGPRLLNGGRYSLNPRREGFRHPGLFGRRTRMAMGLTAHNKLLLVSVSTPVTFGRLAGIMKALGAVDAVCLDGGSSSAMYFRGRIVRRPGRTLTNIVEVRGVPVSPAAVALAQSTTDTFLSKQQEPANDHLAFRRAQETPLYVFSTQEPVAVVPDDGGLRRPKVRRSPFPVSKLKFS